MLEIRDDLSAGLIPLVLSRGGGGPHDEEAFRSGWRLGEIAALLAQPGISAVADAIRPQEREQADLIAMARGYTMTVDPSDDPDWMLVTFVRTEVAP
jgi:hypothetical protein